MNYRKLASAFVTFGLLCPLSTEAIHAQELDKSVVKVEIAQPGLTIGKLTQPQNDTKENIAKKYYLKILSLFFLNLKLENDDPYKGLFYGIAENLAKYKIKYESKYNSLKEIVNSIFDAMLKNDYSEFNKKRNVLFRQQFFLRSSVLNQKRIVFREQKNICNLELNNFLQLPNKRYQLNKLSSEFLGLFKSEGFLQTFLVDYFQAFKLDSKEGDFLSLFSNMISYEYTSAELLLSFLLHTINKVDSVHKHSENLKNKISDHNLVSIPKSNLEYIIETIAESLVNMQPRNFFNVSDSFLQLNLKIHLLYLLDEQTFLNTIQFILKNASLIIKSEKKISIYHIIFYEKLMDSLCSPIIPLYQFPIAKQLLNDFPGFLSIKAINRLSQSLFSSANFDQEGQNPIYKLLKCFSYNPPHAISLLGQLTYENEVQKFEVVKEFLEKIPDYRDWFETSEDNLRSAKFIYEQGKWLMSFLLDSDKNDIKYNDNFQRFLSISELILEKFPVNICEGIIAGLYEVKDQNLLKGLCLAAFNQLGFCKNTLCLLERYPAFSELIVLVKSNPSFFYLGYFSERNIPRELICNGLLGIMFNEYIKNRSTNLEIRSKLLVLQKIFQRYNVELKIRLELVRILIQVIGGRLAHHYFQYFNIDNDEDMEKLYIYIFKKFPQNTKIFFRKEEQQYLARNVGDKDLCKKIFDQSKEIFKTFKPPQKRKLTQGEEPPPKKRNDHQ